MEDKKKDKRKFSLLRVLIGVLVAFFIIVLLMPSPCTTKEKAYQLICGTQLHQTLFVAISSYKDENKKYPASKQWCDEIKPYIEMDKYFRCPADPNGPCSYAMNENIPADANDLPPDLVLLFESAPGWNQVGGPDDVVTNRHGKPGANIAFADGSVKFVKPEDIPTLRWTVSQKRAAETVR